jgi:hypothetical protein
MTGSPVTCVSESRCAFTFVSQFSKDCMYVYPDISRVIVTIEALREGYGEVEYVTVYVWLTRNHKSALFNGRLSHHQTILWLSPPDVTFSTTCRLRPCV